MSRSWSGWQSWALIRQTKTVVSPGEVELLWDLMLPRGFTPLDVNLVLGFDKGRRDDFVAWLNGSKCAMEEDQ